MTAAIVFVREGGERERGAREVETARDTARACGEGEGVGCPERNSKLKSTSQERTAVSDIQPIRATLALTSPS
jgi:hypothetical protein